MARLGNIPRVLGNIGKRGLLGATGGQYQSEEGQPDPQDAFWATLGANAGNALMGLPPVGNPTMEAYRVHEYNTDPVRRQEMERNDLLLRQAQTQYADERIQSVRDQVMDRRAREMYRAGVQSGEIPPNMPFEHWMARGQLKPSSVPSEVLEHEYYAQLSDEGKKDWDRRARAAMTGRYGDVPVYGREGGEFSPMGPAADIAAAQEEITSAEETQAGRVQAAKSQAEIDIAFDSMMANIGDTERQLEYANQMIAEFEAGDYDDVTGPLIGRLSPMFTEEGAMLMAESIGQTLEFLQIVNLAPVTEAELALVGKMAVDPSQTTAANLGRLKRIVRKVEGALTKARAQDAYFIEQGGTLRGYRPAREAAPNDAAQSGPDDVEYVWSDDGQLVPK